MTTINSGIRPWTKRLIGGVGVLALAMVILALASMGMHTTAGLMPMPDGHMWGNGWLGWGLMGIIGLLWMVALIAIPVAVIYWLAGGTQTQEERDTDDALAALREQYARGEISDEEYERRRAKLEDH